MKIAAILTCFNRKEKTVRCLEELFVALDGYNDRHQEDKICLSIYLTDDACTDGTADAVGLLCAGRDLHILKGDGQCYWAGGMRLAWKNALSDKTGWDFFLLLNDDTVVMPNVFDELLECHDYSMSMNGMGGIYSGFTCSHANREDITYGGNVIDKETHGWYLALPTGKPQDVDMTQANILLVSHDVMDKIGIFYDGYIHGAADEDYSMTAKRNGIPVLVTSDACGYCEFDHMDQKQECLKLMGMSLKERRRYVYAPTHSDKDYLLFIRRNMPNRYLISRVLRLVRWICPGLYFKICTKRGIYDK